MVIMVLAGAALICSAAWVAQSNDLAHRLSLDFKGAKARAIAEPMGADQFRLRLDMDSTIYSRSYKGKIDGAPSGTEEFSIPVVYDPANPGAFLPAGLSYKPAGLAAALFLAGMGFSLYARRATYAAARLQNVHLRRPTKVKAKKSDSAKPRHRHRHHKHRRHGASDHHSAEP